MQNESDKLKTIFLGILELTLEGVSETWRNEK